MLYIILYECKNISVTFFDNVTFIQFLYVHRSCAIFTKHFASSSRETFAE